jgi:lipid II:glycine glycyltransferase (peptidoglycan interpeptide bridge formation enzyme)
MNYGFLSSYFITMIRLLTTESDRAQYDRWVRAHPQGSLWQSLEREVYLKACGQTTKIYVVESGHSFLASALVSIDKTMGGFSVWDISRGPLWNEGQEKNVDHLLKQILQDAQQDKCLQLFLSPQLPLPPTCPSVAFEKRRGVTYHLRTSSRRIHAEATRSIDLTLSEVQILAQMHQKGRYNIGVARKNGVCVRTGSVKDIDAFYALLMSTSNRDRFTISQKSHYKRFLTDLDQSFFLMAEYAGKPIAGLIGVMWGGCGIYYYGASSYEHRHLMAPYALQWEAIRFCKAHGCTEYDVLGISKEGAAADDPWWGITDFKRKFGGTVREYAPEQTIILRPVMQKMLEWKRRVFG